MRRVLMAGAVIFPWLPLLLILWLKSAPTGDDVAFLEGEWKVVEADAATSDPTPATITLPGLFGRQGLLASRVVLERTVELPAALSGHPATLVLGDTRSAVLRVWVNGTFVGDVGAFEASSKGDFGALEHLSVPPGVLTGPTALVRLEARCPVPRHAGVVDGRFLLGNAQSLGPWVARTSSIESFLREAPLLVLALLMGLLGLLFRIGADPHERRLALWSAAMSLSAGLYLLLLSGVFVGGLIPTALRVSWVLIAVTLIGATGFEFSIELFEKRVTLPLRINRWVLVVMVPLMVAGAFLPPSFSLAVWRLYAPWPALMCVYLIVTIVRALRVPQNRRTAELLFASALGVTMVAAIVDTLSDVGVLRLPRLFALSLVDAPVITAAVVIGRFVRLAEHNRALSSSLSASNQELARALADAREATRVKSEFLSSMSHELRTPLNSIINIPEGLLEDFEGEGPETRYTGEPSRTAKYLQRLLTSGQHLLGVVNQVLDFSKLEAGRMTLTPERFAVRALLDDVQSTLSGLAGKKRVSLVAAGELDRELAADRVKLSQVLLNLGNNAVKFSPEGGTVTFEVRAVDDVLEFRVRDEGIGIAPENLALIFEGFRQVEGGSTRRFGGTGLGLSISRKLVELHGGELVVESQPEKGSTFIARVPVAPRQLAVRQFSPSAPGRRVILVVDDEVLVHETIKLSLRELDVDVVCLDDPRHAVSAVEQLAPALVVLDVMMPRVSGLAVLRSLRSNHALASVPVLVLSAWPTNREMVEQLGARWMSKPWVADELVSVVRGLTGLTDLQGRG